MAQSTYAFFDLPSQMPTDVYEYQEAVEKDHVLVPYYPIETATTIPDDGITYDNHSDDEKEAFEEEFSEDDEYPDHIPSDQVNKYIFNQSTVDYMISDLMSHGIKHSAGNHVGKTIIFAQNKRHAQYILDRFDDLYKEYHGTFACKIVSGEPYTQDDYDNFKKKDSMPFIAITVDKLETGVDIPEVVNLVFAKKVYSRIKFDQMLGRGTRLCKDLFGINEHKKEFYVFDYMRNFQFFEMHPKGKESASETSPVAVRFARRVEIIALTQDAEYSGEEYQKIRSTLVDDVTKDISDLNPERIEVGLKRKYVEKYKDRNQFTCLDDEKKHEIRENLSGLIQADERDEAAISFDVTMYGLMITVLSKKQLQKQHKKTVCGYANTLLEKCATIPEVKEKIQDLKDVTRDEFWDTGDAIRFEETRKRLRNVMKYVQHEAPRIHYTNFTDEVTYREEGRDINIGGNDFAEYRHKVNRYVEDHKNQSTTIHKLLYNEPISAADYQELKRIFTEELGTEKDYENSFHDTPFGILIRKIAKMDYDAAMAAFGSFIAEEHPNAEQIAFIEKIVHYVVENGCIELKELRNAPFDRPVKFSALFTMDEQQKIVDILELYKKNAGTA